MIEAGMHCKLSGLVAWPLLNGLTGRAIQFKRGRWEVELMTPRPEGGDQIVRVKPENLVATSATGGGGGGAAAPPAFSSPATTLSASAAQHSLGLASPPVQLQLSAADAGVSVFVKS